MRGGYQQSSFSSNTACEMMNGPTGCWEMADGEGRCTWDGKKAENRRCFTNGRRAGVADVLGVAEKLRTEDVLQMVEGLGMAKELKVAVTSINISVASAVRKSASVKTFLPTGHKPDFLKPFMEFVIVADSKEVVPKRDAIWNCVTFLTQPSPKSMVIIGT